MKRAALVIDDMISGGGTLFEVCEELIRQDVEEIYVCCVHGIFAGNFFEKLEKFNLKYGGKVKGIISTNSIESEKSLVSLAPLVIKALGEKGEINAQNTASSPVMPIKSFFVNPRVFIERSDSFLERIRKFISWQEREKLKYMSLIGYRGGRTSVVELKEPISIGPGQNIKAMEFKGVVYRDDKNLIQPPLMERYPSPVVAILNRENRIILEDRLNLKGGLPFKTRKGNSGCCQPYGQTDLKIMIIRLPTVNTGITPIRGKPLAFLFE